jgi:hypothetical protein
VGGDLLDREQAEAQLRGEARSADQALAPFARVMAPPLRRASKVQMLKAHDE